MSLRLILKGKVKDGVSSQTFSDFARRAAKASEDDSGVVAHSFFTDDESHYWEEHVFTDEAGFFDQDRRQRPESSISRGCWCSILSTSR